MRPSPLVLLLVLTLLVACTPAAVGPPVPTVPPTLPPAAVANTVAPPDTPVPPTNAPPPTDTPVPPTNTSVPPTDTPAPTDTPVPTGTPVPTAVPTASQDAVVKLATLNVRAGPGTAYAVVGKASQGDVLTIIGQAGKCAWLKIKTAENKEGWVAAGSDYVTFARPCADIPLSEVPPTPVRPTSPPPAAEPSKVPTEKPGASLPSDQGCYLIENFLGAELTFTITRPGWTDTFKIGPMAQHVMCLAPGQYTYTIDAPPPWGASNGSMDVVAGQHFRFPISGRK